MSRTQRLEPAQPYPPRRYTRWESKTAAALFAAAAILALAPGAAASACPPRLPMWQLVSPAGTATFRSIDAVSRRVAWIGSDDGTILETVDGGRSWRDVSPAGAAGLHFRDLHALDDRRAVAMTAGAGSDSRVYWTSDGGRGWRLGYQSTDPATYFDSMEFFDIQHGLIMSDPEDGKFQILSTSDGGRSWTRLSDAGMPISAPDEYGFADSGTTLAMAEGQAWFGSGGSVARVYHSADGGLTWDVSSTPIASGPPGGGAGILGLAFRSPDQGLAVGGDLDNADLRTGLSAYLDSRHRWVAPAREPSGFRFAAVWLPGGRASVIAVGANGSDVSFDGGQHWTAFDEGEFNSVNCAGDGACWAAGDAGRVALLRY
jgi:photosystem II stability/assembly factor-like uncharacterized protein